MLSINHVWFLLVIVKLPSYWKTMKKMLVLTDRPACLPAIRPLECLQVQLKYDFRWKNALTVPSLSPLISTSITTGIYTFDVNFFDKSCIYQVNSISCWPIGGLVIMVVHVCTCVCAHTRACAHGRAVNILLYLSAVLAFYFPSNNWPSSM